MQAAQLPPTISREAAREVAAALREVAKALETLAEAPAEDWGLQAADLGLQAMAAGEVMADSGMAVAALEGQSLRKIGESAGFAFSAIPRRLAGTPELGGYAEQTKQGWRVTQGGIERARYDLRTGTYRADGDPEPVARRGRA